MDLQELIDGILNSSEGYRDSFASKASAGTATNPFSIEEPADRGFKDYFGTLAQPGRDPIEAVVNTKRRYQELFDELVRGGSVIKRRFTNPDEHPLMSAIEANKASPVREYFPVGFAPQPEQVNSGPEEQVSQVMQQLEQEEAEKESSALKEALNLFRERGVATPDLLAEMPVPMFSIRGDASLPKGFGGSYTKSKKSVGEDANRAILTQEANEQQQRLVELAEAQGRSAENVAAVKSMDAKSAEKLIQLRNVGAINEETATLMESLLALMKKSGASKEELIAYLDKYGAK